MVLLTIGSEKDRPEDFEVYFTDPIPLGGYNYEVALLGFNIWFSWHNISHEYMNNVLKFYNGTNWQTIVLPNGFYTIELINYFLKSIENKVVFDVNEITSRCILKLKPGYKIDFSEGKLNEILGFEAKIIDKTDTEGKFPINITNGIDRILIHCSLVEKSYLRNVKSDVIYSFVPETPPSSLITINPNPPIYLPVRENKLIHTIRMQITDQRNRPLNLNNEPVTYMLYLRPK